MRTTSAKPSPFPVPTAWLVAATMAAFACPSTAGAADAIRVLKTSGNRATVEFVRSPDGGRGESERPIAPEPGQTFWLAPATHRPSNGARAAGGDAGRDRERTIAASAELSALTESRSQLTSSRLALSGKYGWNWTEWEAGPSAAFTYTQSDPNALRRIEAGGFGDWNFVPNDGREAVYGATAALRVGQTERARGAARYSNGLVALDAGFVAKWFALRAASAALRFDVLYSYESETGDGPFAATSTGFKALAGLQVYF